MTHGATCFDTTSVALFCCVHTVELLGFSRAFQVDNGFFTVAAAFGNVHGAMGTGVEA